MAKTTNSNRSKSLSPLAKEIKESLEEYAALKRGKRTGAVTYNFKPRIPKNVDVKGIRHKLGMTQEQFASFGFSLSAIRHWESHRRTPEGPARILLMVIDRDPRTVLDTLR